MQIYYIIVYIFVRLSLSKVTTILQITLSLTQQAHFHRADNE